MQRGDRTAREGMGSPGNWRSSCYGWRRGGGGGGRGTSGRGRWRHWYYATGIPGWIRFGGLPPTDQELDPDAEKRILEEQAEDLQAKLDSIRSRLKGMGQPSGRTESGMPGEV